MTDEIVGGSDGPEPGSGVLLAPRPGLGPRLVLLILPVLLLGYVVTHRYDPPPKVAPARLVAVPLIRPVPYVDGELGTGPRGLRLLVGGTFPQIIDAASSEMFTVPELRVFPDSTVAAFPLASGSIAAVSEPYGKAGGRYFVRQSGDPVLIGADPDVLPSRDGQLILTVTRAGGTSVAGYTLDRRLRWQWQRTGLVVPLRDTPAGLLVQRFVSPAGGGSALLLVDRNTGRVRRSIAAVKTVLASSDRLVAWQPAGCISQCLLHVTELATGKHEAYRMPPDWLPARAAFAPNGRSLALTVPGLSRSTATPLGFVTVLDLRRGTYSRIQNVGISAELGAEVGWSRDSRVLIIAVTFAERQRYVLWQPGRPLTVLVDEVFGHPGPFYVL